MSQGATPELVEKLDDYEASDLPERTKAALRLADKLWSEDKALSPEFYADLGEHFSDDQILDLGMCISFMSSWQQFIEAFGIVPDSWKNADTPPQFGPTLIPPTN